MHNNNTRIISFQFSHNTLTHSYIQLYMLVIHSGPLILIYFKYSTIIVTYSYFFVVKLSQPHDLCVVYLINTISGSIPNITRSLHPAWVTVQGPIEIYGLFITLTDICGHFSAVDSV